jgi:hypothetical protein
MTDIKRHVNRLSVGFADECPALVELAAHRANPDEEIARHLQDCPRCRALLRAMRAESLEQVELDFDLPHAVVPERSPPPGALAAGELVTVSSERVPNALLVALVLAVEANAARVAPVVASADLADHEAAGLVLPTETPLGYKAAVDVDCIGWVESSQAGERFGALSVELFTRVRNALSHPASSNPVSPQVRQRRDEASLFFLPALGELFRKTEASESTLEGGLQSVGWTSEDMTALRGGLIDPTRVSPEQMASLFHLAGWASDGGAVARDTAIRALRLALAERLALPTVRSKTTAAMAFLAQVPGISKRSLTADEYFDAVIRALDERDA